MMSLMSRLMRTWILRRLRKNHRKKNHRKKSLRKKNLMNSFLSMIRNCWRRKTCCLNYKNRNFLSCFQHFSLPEQNSFLNYN